MRKTLTNDFCGLHKKSMDWFLHDNGLRHERIKCKYSEARSQFSKNSCSEKYRKMHRKTLSQVFLLNFTKTFEISFS